jgi:predicted Rdx family selenoprotein
VSLANDLQAHGHDAGAVPGKKSQFDVVADGVLLFSKQAEGRYPEQDEILAKLN